MLGILHNTNYTQIQQELTRFEPRSLSTKISDTDMYGVLGFTGRIVTFLHNWVGYTVINFGRQL